MAFINDFIVFSNAISEHVDRLKIVLQNLWEALFVSNWILYKPIYFLSAFVSYLKCCQRTDDTQFDNMPIVSFCNISSNSYELNCRRLQKPFRFLPVSRLMVNIHSRQFVGHGIGYRHQLGVVAFLVEGNWNWDDTLAEERPGQQELHDLLVLQLVELVARPHHQAQHQQKECSPEQKEPPGPGHCSSTPGLLLDSNKERTINIACASTRK